MAPALLATCQKYRFNLRDRVRRSPTMDYSPRVLGKHAADVLHTRSTSAVLIIGRDGFTRGDLADVSCFCYVAARNLSALLEDFGVKDTRDVYDNVAPIMLAIPKLGAISLAVLGAAFEKKGLGGSAPLESWIKKHTRNKKSGGPEIVSFDALKHRSKDQQAATRERKARNKRGRS